MGTDVDQTTFIKGAAVPFVVTLTTIGSGKAVPTVPSCSFPLTASRLKTSGCTSPSPSLQATEKRLVATRHAPRCRRIPLQYSALGDLQDSSAPCGQPVQPLSSDIFSN